MGWAKHIRLSLTSSFEELIMADNSVWNFPWSYNDFESDFKREKNNLDNGHGSLLKQIHGEKNGVSLYLFDDNHWSNYANGHRQTSVIFEEATGRIIPIKMANGNARDAEGNVWGRGAQGDQVGTWKFKDEEIIRITDQNREYATKFFGIKADTEFLLVTDHKAPAHGLQVQGNKYITFIDANGSTSDSVGNNDIAIGLGIGTTSNQLMPLRGEQPEDLIVLEDSGNRALFKDSNGSLWVGGDDGSLQPLSIRTLDYASPVSNFGHST